MSFTDLLKTVQYRYTLKAHHIEAPPLPSPFKKQKKY